MLEKIVYRGGEDLWPKTSLARQGIASGLLEVHRAPPRTHPLADCWWRSHYYLAPSSE